MSSKVKDTQDAEKLLSKSAKGVTFLLFGQVFTKFSTFILNQLLIIYISPRIFGINSFLEFLINTTLFFSREGIRLSSQRINDSLTAHSPDDEDDEVALADEKKLDKYDHSKIFQGTKLGLLQSIINIGYVPLLIGFPLSSVIVYWQFNKISDFFTHMHLFNLSIGIIWLSIVVELMSEPLYILNQFNLNYEKRTRFESFAITANCFVNFAIIFWSRNQTSIDGLPIFAFSVGKLNHSLALLITYYVDFRSYKKSTPNAKRLHLTPTRIYTNNTKYHYFDHDVISHFYKIFFQLCFKHLLTEGDKLIINSFCTIEEQGIYSLISNYGSLLARLVFAPIEESLRNFLTRLLLANKSIKNLNLSVDILRKIIAFYIYLSTIIIIFGPLNSGYLIQKMIGNNWSNHVSNTIPLYTLYLPLLAFNGILESVHQSTASGNEVVTYTYYMVVFSVSFMITSYIGIEKFKLSLHGLILSNMINMLLRIVYCNRFITNFYRKNLISSSIWKLDGNFKSILIFSLGIWGIDVLLFGVTRNFKELAGNVVFALILVGFIMYKEKDLVLSTIKRKKPIAE